MKRRIMGIFLAMALLLAIPSGARGGSGSLVTVHFIDVGQGDCIFIDDGDFEVLIDAGVAGMGQRASEYIAPFVSGELDLIIATHAHADHVGGLSRVIEDFDVARIIDSGDEANSKAFREYYGAAMGEKGCEFIPDSDMTVSLPHGEIKIMEIFDGEENFNNDSVTALLIIGGVQVLFTGDSEEKAEELIGGRVGDVDVFKAGHHGSRTANTLSFLEEIRPEYVVISCGEGNSYGHPHLEALQNFADVGAVSYSTEKSGTVVMTTDGSSYWFNTDAALDEDDAGGR